MSFTALSQGTHQFLESIVDCGSVTTSTDLPLWNGQSFVHLEIASEWSLSFECFLMDQGLPISLNDPCRECKRICKVIVCPHDTPTFEPVEGMIFGAKGNLSYHASKPEIHIARSEDMWPIGRFMPEKSCGIVHLYAGAFGGWSQAQRWLAAKTHLHEPHQTILVERDEDVCSYVQTTLGIRCINLNDTELPSTDKIVIPADVADIRWLRQVRSGQNLVCTASFPCQPFSRGGKKIAGIDSDDGRSIIRASVNLRVLQPIAFALENVANFKSHPHASFVLAFLRWAGYHMIWDQCHELGQISCANRLRWLGVFIRNDIKEEFVGGRFGLCDHRKQQWNSSLYDFIIPQSLSEQLEITPDLLPIYGDKRLLPYAKQTSFMTQQDVLKARCPEPEEQLATLVASYTSQHLLPRDHIEKSGIFAELHSIDGEKFHFFDPVRWASILGNLHTLFLPKEAREAFKILGNCIAVPHAALAMVIMFNVTVLKEHPLPVTLTIFRMWRDRTTAMNSLVCEFDQGYALATPNDFVMCGPVVRSNICECVEVTGRIVKLLWPDGTNSNIEIPQITKVHEILQMLEIPNPLKHLWGLLCGEKQQILRGEQILPDEMKTFQLVFLPSVRFDEISEKQDVGISPTIEWTIPDDLIREHLQKELGGEICRKLQLSTGSCIEIRVGQNDAIRDIIHHYETCDVSENLVAYLHDQMIDLQMCVKDIPGGTIRIERIRNPDEGEVISSGALGNDGGFTTRDSTVSDPNLLESCNVPIEARNDNGSEGVPPKPDNGDVCSAKGVHEGNDVVIHHIDRASPSRSIASVENRNPKYNDRKTKEGLIQIDAILSSGAEVQVEMMGRRTVSDLIRTLEAYGHDKEFSVSVGNESVPLQTLVGQIPKGVVQIRQNLKRKCSETHFTNLEVRLLDGTTRFIPTIGRGTIREAQRFATYPDALIDRLTPECNGRILQLDSLIENLDTRCIVLKCYPMKGGAPSAKDPLVKNDPWANFKSQSGSSSSNAGGSVRWDQLLLEENHPWHTKDGQRTKQVSILQLGPKVGGVAFGTRNNLAMLSNFQATLPTLILLPGLKEGAAYDPALKPLLMVPQQVVVNEPNGKSYKRIVIPLALKGEFIFKLTTEIKAKAATSAFAELVVELHEAVVASTDIKSICEQPLEIFRRHIASLPVAIRELSIYSYRKIKSKDGHFIHQVLMKAPDSNRRALLTASGKNEFFIRQYLHGSEQTDHSLLQRYWQINVPEVRQAIQLGEALDVAYAGLALTNKGIAIRAWNENLNEARATVLQDDVRFNPKNRGIVINFIYLVQGYPFGISHEAIIESLHQALGLGAIPLRSFKLAGLLTWIVGFQQEPKTLQFVLAIGDESCEILLTKQDNQKPKPNKIMKDKKSNPKKKDGSTQPLPVVFNPITTASGGTKNVDTENRLNALENKVAGLETSHNNLATKVDGRFDDISDQLRQVLSAVTQGSKPSATRPRDAGGQTGETPPPKQAKS